MERTVSAGDEEPIEDEAAEAIWEAMWRALGEPMPAGEEKRGWAERSVVIRKAPREEDAQAQEESLQARRRAYFREIGRRGGKKSAEVRRQRAAERKIEEQWRLRDYHLKLWQSELDALQVVSERTGIPVAAIVRDMLATSLESVGWDRAFGTWRKPFRPGDWQK